MVYEGIFKAPKNIFQRFQVKLYVSLKVSK